MIKSVLKYGTTALGAAVLGFIAGNALQTFVCSMLHEVIHCAWCLVPLGRAGTAAERRALHEATVEHVLTCPAHPALPVPVLYSIQAFVKQEWGVDLPVPEPEWACTDCTHL